MRGRCENCNQLLDVSDSAETYKCPACGNRSHPEFLRAVNPKPRKPVNDPMTPTSGEFCECGHPKEHHIYHEGACRGGYVCTRGCVEFRPLVTGVSSNGDGGQSHATGPGKPAAGEVTGRTTEDGQPSPRRTGGSFLSPTADIDALRAEALADLNRRQRRRWVRPIRWERRWDEFQHQHTIRIHLRWPTYRPRG